MTPEFWLCHYCSKKSVQKGTTCQTWDTDCVEQLNVNGQAYLKMKLLKEQKKTESIGIAQISDEGE